jgi:iron-sulfur cluster assembly protein
MYNINFTATAVAHLVKNIAQQQGLGLRLSVKQTGCAGFSYVPSIVTEEISGDLSFVWQKQLKVYLDPAAIIYLQDLTIDFAVVIADTNIQQKRLVFSNPNEKSRCGCGESFHV